MGDSPVVKTKFFPPEFERHYDGIMNCAKDRAFFYGISYQLLKNLKVEYDYSDGSMILSYDFADKDILDGKRFKGHVVLTEQQLRDADEKMKQEEYAGADPYNPLLNKLMNMNLVGAREVLEKESKDKDVSKKIFPEDIGLRIKDKEIKGWDDS